MIESIDCKKGSIMNEKILIVEDEKEIAHLIRDYLTASNYQVVLAEDGEAGLLAFEKEKPNLAILDIMMPKKDGFEVCRNIRAKSNIPILMLSAKKEDTDKIIEQHLEAAEAEDLMSEKYSDMFRDIEGETKQIINNITTTINDSELSTEEQINFIYNKTKELQKRVNYDGNYLAWAEKKRPVRLENMDKSYGR